MSYHFWKAVFNGMLIADVIGFIGLCVFLYFNGGNPLSDPLAAFQFRLIAVIYVIMTIGTFYSWTIHKTKYKIARLRNLDRVHPLGGGRRRFNG